MTTDGPISKKLGLELTFKGREISSFESPEMKDYIKTLLEVDMYIQLLSMCVPEKDITSIIPREILHILIEDRIHDASRAHIDFQSESISLDRSYANKFIDRLKTAFKNNRRNFANNFNYHMKIINICSYSFVKLSRKILIYFSKAKPRDYLKIMDVSSNKETLESTLSDCVYYDDGYKIDLEKCMDNHPYFDNQKVRFLANINFRRPYRKYRKETVDKKVKEDMKSTPLPIGFLILIMSFSGFASCSDAVDFTHKALRLLVCEVNETTEPKEHKSHIACLYDLEDSRKYEEYKRSLVLYETQGVQHRARKMFKSMGINFLNFKDIAEDPSAGDKYLAFFHKVKVPLAYLTNGWKLKNRSISQKRQLTDRVLDSYNHKHFISVTKDL